MNQYDYIIAGTGASGLMLAYAMIKDPFFKYKRILLLDQEKKQHNDRTWCFWEQGAGMWDEVVSKKWNTILVSDQKFSSKVAIAPYTYKYIRSSDFYSLVYEALAPVSNITMRYENILSVNEEGNGAVVQTKENIYRANKVFTSILPSLEYKKQKKFPVLQQHFVGWFITVEHPSFDDSIATFMDFSVPQFGNTRFMYVLPITTRHALFEYTLFSEDLLPHVTYEEAIKDYLNKKGIIDYKIEAVEKGSIPMTAFPFSHQNSKNILHIGTAGGWTKASTGFTFKNSSRRVNDLIQFLKRTQDLTKFDKKTRFWFYDLLFLDVLAKHNDKGSLLFLKLFKSNTAASIFQFLDEKTNVLQEVKIMGSMPSLLFVKAIVRRLSRML